MPRGRRSSALGILAALGAAGVAAVALLGGRVLDGAREAAPAGRPGAAAARPATAEQEHGSPDEGASAAALAATGAAPARAAIAVPDRGADGAEPPASDLPPPAPWSGRVLAAGSDDPLAGVRVVLRHTALEVAAETDSAGGFALAWPEGLAAELALEHPAFVDHHVAEARLEPDALFRLEPAGRIRGAVSGWPPPGQAALAPAEALLWPHDPRRRDDEAYRSAALDTQGRFAFEDVEPGAWNLAVQAPGASIEEQAGLELAPGETLDVALLARAGGVLRGRVQDRASGAPLAGVDAVVRSLRSALPEGAEERFTREVRTDAAGSFLVSGLAPGALRVDLHLPWGAEQRATGAIPETLEPAELVVLVAAPARLQGLVLDAAGQPAAGAVVLALPRGDRDRIEAALEARGAALDPQAASDAAGAFALPAVPAEEPLLLLAFPAGAGAPGSANVAPLAAGGALEGALVRLPAATSVSGFALDPEGRAPPETTLELGPLVGGASSPLLAVAAAPDGSFLCEGVPAGAVLIEAQAPGYLPRRLRVDVPPEGAADVRLELVPSFIVEGRVVDEGGGGRSGVQVRLELDPASLAGEAALAEGDAPRRSDHTDAYGRFQLERLTRGRWLPSIRSGDWELARATPPVLELPGEAELVLELRRTVRPELASVSGEIWARDGGAILDVRIGGLGQGSVLTTAGPSFRARGVEPGTKQLEISAQGCVPERRGPVELLPGAEYDLGRIELERGTQVDVRVLDPEGKPLNGARVVLRPLPVEKGGASRGAWSWRLGRRDRGLYRAEGVPRARWRLRVTHDGMKAHDELITVGEKPSRVEVRLIRP